MRGECLKKLDCGGDCKFFWAGKMSDCRNRFGKDAGCSSPAQPMSHILRASAIVATAVFLCITIVLVIVILHKRGVFLLVRLRPRVPRIPPALYVWSAPATATDAEPTTPQPESTTPPTPTKASKKAKTPPEPLSCVIMAGDDRPTHLARPLPRDEFVDVNQDRKLDELERGKRKAPLISSR